MVDRGLAPPSAPVPPTSTRSSGEHQRAVDLREFLALRPKKNLRQIAWRVIDGEAAIVNLRDGTLHALNQTGTKVWEAADGQTSVAEIIGRLLEEFDVGREPLEDDCAALLTAMAQRGLMTLAPARAPAGPSSVGTLEPSGRVFEDLREAAAAKKVPLVGHLDLTYRCNLKCAHCYIVREKRHELSAAEVEGILVQLADAGTLYLTLSGGEILLRKDFFQIAERARELSFAVRLLTNGTWIDEGRADRIAALMPELVAISIYSATPTVHDEITGEPRSYEKSCTAAKMLRARGVRVKLSTVIMAQNRADYRAVHGLAKEIGAEFQADHRIAPKNNGDRGPMRLEIDENGLRGLLCDPIFFREEEPEPQSQYVGIFDTIPCGAGHMAVYVSPYGDVYPCVQLPISCGNLREHSFTEIWRRSSQLREVRAVTIGRLAACCRCDLLRFCRPCIGLSYLEEGDMRLPLPRACREAMLMRELGKARR